MCFHKVAYHSIKYLANRNTETKCYCWMKFPYFQTVKIHLTGLYLSSWLFYSLLVSIFRRNFCIQTQCFHFHIWKVIFPFETFPSIYCYNFRGACCNVVKIRDRHWHRNQCFCILIFATDLLCSSINQVTSVTVSPAIFFLKCLL